METFDVGRARPHSATTTMFATTQARTMAPTRVTMAPTRARATRVSTVTRASEGARATTEFHRRGLALWIGHARRRVARRRDGARDRTIATSIDRSRARRCRRREIVRRARGAARAKTIEGGRAGRARDAPRLTTERAFNRE